AAHKTRYDAAIADTRDRALSTEDANRIREAVDAIAAGNLSKAKALRDQVRDPTGAKLIDWYRYRSGYGAPEEIRAFLAANPAWPDRALLTRRSEEDLLESGTSAAAIKAFFAQSPPTTAVGLAALAGALAADNDEAA